jgi:hypothetical protein
MPDQWKESIVVPIHVTVQIFNFALDYGIGNVPENQAGLKLNGTHQPLAYADDVNPL